MKFNIAFTGNYVTGISAGPKDRVIGTGGVYTLTLLITDDGVVESDGSVTVTLTSGSGYTLGNPATASVTVTDNGLPPAQPPVAFGAIPDITMAVGATQDVNVSGAFTGTVGSYTAVSGATDKATVALVSGTTYRVTGVAVGTATITVTATNSVGSATQTFTVTVAASVVQLPAPTGLTAVWASDSVVLEWDVVPTATSYNAQWKAAGESYDAVSRQGTATDINHVISGLTPGTAYTLRVAAVLNNVVGVWSAEVTTPATTVTIAGGLRVNEGNPPTGQQRRPVLGYPLTFSPAITEPVTVYYAYVKAGTTAAWADDFSFRSSLLADGPLLDALTATEFGRPSVFEIDASDANPVTTAYLLVQIRGDNVYELDETVQIRLLGAANAALGSTLEATETIVNDDAQPQLIVPDDALFAAEGEDLEIIVGLSAPSATSGTVSVQDLGTGSATSGTDYPVIPGTLTFAPNVVRQTLSIQLTDDTEVEGNETINLRFNSGGRPVDVTVTIVDEDMTYPAISIAAVDSPVTEGAPAQFRVTANPAPTTDLDVRLSIGQEGAYAADDELGTKTVTIPANAASAIYDVPTVDDGTAEHNGSVTATLNSGLGYTIGAPSEATVAVHDPVQLPEATGTIPNASVTIGETHEVDAATYFAGTVVTYTAVSSDTDAATVAVSNTSTVTVTGVAVGTATITVRATNLAGPTDQTFIVTVAADPDIPVITIAAGADATEGTDAVFTVTASPAPMSALDVSLTIGQTGDYVEVTNLGSGKTVTILANAASATYPVPTVGDSVHEPSGAVTATVTAGAGYTVGASNSDSVTVTNDDARPTLTFDVPAVTEGGKGTTATMSFAVTSSGASTYLVRCWTQGGTADINVDYVGRNTNTPGQGPDFNISDPSQLSKMFDVTVNGDDIDEANESINTRCGFVGVVGYSADGAGTITDDDTAGLAFTPSSLTVNEGSTNTYRVALTSEPTGDVVVTPLSGDTTAVTVSGALTFTPDNWRTQQTVTLTGVVDTDTVGEVVTISHSAVGGRYDSVTGDVTATAIDSGGPVMFSIDSPSANEGTRALTFTVSLNRNPAGTTPQVSYRLATDSGTATGGADYIAANAIGTVHFSGSDTEATFTINVTNDGKDEADETIRIELHNPSGGTISATSAGVGTIVDDDAPPVVSVNWAETGVNEGQDMVFRVTLSEASGRVVTVKYDDDGTGTAMAGSADTDDYQTVTLTTVTFEPTNTSLERIVRVPTVNNAFDQDARTMVLKILDPVNATLNPSMSTATVTIADNDATPVIEVSSPSADEHGGTLDFVVSLRGESAKEIKVSYADAGTGTATVGQDYEAVTAGTLTFPAYTAASQTVSVTILDDTLNVRDAAEATSERVNLTFSNPLNAVFAGAQTTLTPTGAIRDNDLVLDTVIPDTTRQVGETFTFNLANIAFDADTHAASSSNTSVATTEVTGSGIDTMLTVTAVSEGTATITMTLSLLTTGGSVTDEFIFTVTPLSVITITAGSASVTEGAGDIHRGRQPRAAGRPHRQPDHRADRRLRRLRRRGQRQDHDHPGERGRCHLHRRDCERRYRQSQRHGDGDAGERHGLRRAGQPGHGVRQRQRQRHARRQHLDVRRDGERGRRHG